MRDVRSKNLYDVTHIVNLTRQIFLFLFCQRKTLDSVFIETRDQCDTKKPTLSSLSLSSPYASLSSLSSLSYRVGFGHEKKENARRRNRKRADWPKRPFSLSKMLYAFFFAQSVLIKLALPQAAQLSINIFLRKINSVAPRWGTWLRTHHWLGREEHAQHLAGFEPTTSLSWGMWSTTIAAEAVTCLGARI